MAQLVVCGAINWDTTCFVEDLPQPGEEVTASRVTRVAGGTGGNVAVAAARVLGPAQVALIASLGQDDIASLQVQVLESEGVATEGIDRVAQEESGQAYIFVDTQGQNVIASHLGANRKLSTAHLHKQSVEALLDGCRGMAITDPPLDVAAEFAHMAAHRKVPVFWDPGILTAYGWQTLGPIAVQIDTLLANEAEAATLFGPQDPTELTRLPRDLPSTLVLKLGSRGARTLLIRERKLIDAPPFPLAELGFSIASTVGCGDVFAGVFAAYRTLRRPVSEALTMADAAAALNAAVQQTRGSPTRATLEETVDKARRLGFRVTEHRLPDDSR